MRNELSIRRDVLAKQILSCLSAITGCQDTYVDPDYSIPDLIAQVREDHALIELRANADDLAMLHHSLHEVDASLHQLINFDSERAILPGDRLTIRRASARMLREYYRKMDDVFHREYRIDYALYSEEFSDKVLRLESLLD